MNREKVEGTKKALLALPAVAAIVSVALYSSQATQLFYLGISNYEAGLPLAGLVFIWIFLGLRRHEFAVILNARGRNAGLAAVGATMVVIPYPPLLLHYAFVHSYAYAGVAIATCWVGVMVLLEPKTFKFLLPYLAAYVAAVGSATYLDSFAGDPLAYLVAYIGRELTSLSGLQVHWTSVFFDFTASGGGSMSFFIAQECSGTVSVSLLLLLVALMYLDMRGRPGATLAIAAGGTLLFVFLNALRVYTMIVGGIYSGPGLFHFFHQWVGYAYYAVGYSLIILLYVRFRGGRGFDSSSVSQVVGSPDAFQGPGAPAQANPDAGRYGQVHHHCFWWKRAHTHNTTTISGGKQPPPLPRAGFFSRN